MDLRDADIDVVCAKGSITFFKKGTYLCTALYSSNFGEPLVGYFNEHVGLTAPTLRDIADVLDRVRVKPTGREFLGSP